MAKQITPAGREPKTRISAKTRAALTFMVNEGLSRAKAAEKAGITDNWMSRNSGALRYWPLERSLWR